MKDKKNKIKDWLLAGSCKLKDDSGMTLMLSLIILSNILVIALAVGVFSLNQLKIAASVKESGYAIFAGTSGLEKAFYNIRVNPGNCTAVPSPIVGNLSNGAVYSVVVDCASAAIPTCDPIAKAVVLTSNGQYGQSKTTRGIEGSWCN